MMILWENIWKPKLPRDLRKNKKGKGGRNQEFCLSIAIEIDGINNITFLSGGSDGTDGQTEAAGAICNGRTIERAKELGLDAIKFLNNNNSYNFFTKLDDLLITGPTDTNVMDIQLVLIGWYIF